MKNLRKIVLISILATFIFSLYGCGQSTETIDLTISAAASLKEVMAEIESEFKNENKNINLTFNFGGSGSLQKQIEQGAPSDLFISAGQSQMNNLLEEGLLVDDTVKNLVKNQLVLVTTSDSIKNINDLTSDKVQHIAIGEPSSVPAGKYADESLTSLGLKDKLTSKLVFAKDVKEVLSWTASGNAEAGFVYLSDIYNIDSVRIVQTLPEDSHSPITYPVAVINSTKNLDAAKAFENFLFSDKASRIFEKYGFDPINS